MKRLTIREKLEQAKPLDKEVIKDSISVYRDSIKTEFLKLEESHRLGEVKAAQVRFNNFIRFL